MKSSLLLPPSLAIALLITACGPAADTAPAPAAEEAPATDAAPSADAATTGAEPAPAAEAPAELPTHPALLVETLDNGPFDLSQKRGQWVVVNFWATWCKPCLKEIPDLTAFDAGRDDVQVIGLAYEEIEPDALREFLVRHPAGYPIAIIDTFSPPADFETPRGLPTTWLIAPDGSVAKKFLGPITSQELAAAIDAAAAPSASGT